eukprot:SAG11_NODE_1516_length_4766_cov_1.916006_1_plen_105_part_00
MQAAPAAVRGPASGSLFIVGGGEMAHLVPTFLRLGGGASDCQLVVFPTAMDDGTLRHPQLGSLLAQPWLDGGLPAACISIMHTRDRQTADSDDFNVALQAATAV